MEETVMVKLNENRNRLEEIVETKKNKKEIAEKSKEEPFNNAVNSTCDACRNTCKVTCPFEKHNKGSLRCIHNDTGHCRYGRQCYFRHVGEICELNQDCVDPNCEKHHPLPCRYGSQCIFGQTCSFSHGNKDVGLNVNKENKSKEYVGRHESLNLGSRDDTK